MSVDGATAGTWQNVTCTVDSGAVDHVFPEGSFPQAALQPSALSKAGRSYVSATSESIPNLGEKRVSIKTNEGQRKAIRVQIAKVRKPLVSAARLNEQGNDVILSSSNPRIINNRTKEITKLRKQGRGFLLDLWFFEPAATSKSGGSRP